MFYDKHYIFLSVLYCMSVTI